MAKSKKLEHGERNKSLAEELNKGKKYFDWVVTTAFYSSIHLLEDKLLPCTIGAQTCSDIQEVKRAYNLKGRHVSRLKLILMTADPDIAIYYKWLDDRSRYARYTTFKINNSESDKAIQYLNSIYKYCCQ